LFKLLSDAHPSVVTDLSYQYRMNEDIMLLSNRLIYEGRLKCGSETVAGQSLALPGEKDCKSIFHEAECETCWVQDLFSPR
jgi:DNA replication ATP-dependent helicase Dna2